MKTTPQLSITSAWAGLKNGRILSEAKLIVCIIHEIFYLKNSVGRVLAPYVGGRGFEPRPIMPKT